jgi:hypothetical protein
MVNGWINGVLHPVEETKCFIWLANMLKEWRIWFGPAVPRVLAPDQIPCIFNLLSVNSPTTLHAYSLMWTDM